MSIETKTLRERLQEELSEFQAVEAAIFTTYTLVPDFFEQNVLPLLFGIEGSGQVRRRVQVNRRLQTALVALFYDMSTQPRGGSEFRYQLVPVRPNKGGVFHPKIGIVVGHGREEDAPAALVCVSSANLTLKAWAHNEEAVGIFWVNTEAQREELLALIGYLARQARRAAVATKSEDRVTEIEALTRVREGIRSLEGLRRAASEGHEFRCFGLGRRNEVRPAAVITPGRANWATLTAFSPYWSSREDTLDLRQEFRAREVGLIPAPKASGERVRLGIHGSHQVTEYAVRDESLRRFRHAKLYVAEGKFGRKRRTRVTLGSANFTTAALGSEGYPPRNVEALVSYEILPRQRAKVIPALVELADDVQQSAHGITEESDRPLPFDIFVAFDWPAREYRVSLASKGRATDFSLVLPGAGEQPIKPGEHVVKSVSGPTTSKEFSIWYRLGEESPDREVAHGLITELGLDESDHKYTPALKLDDFFASWFRIDPDSVFDDPDTGDLDEEEQASALEALDTVAEDQLDATNLFDTYRALARLESIHLEPAAKDKEWGTVREYLVTRPDSVDQLARVLERQSTSAAVRFGLLLECRRLLEAYGGRHLGELGKRSQTRVEKVIQESRDAVLHELRASQRVHDTATETLEWFEQELMEAGR